MPSVLILDCAAMPPGDGGGVCAAARPDPLGRSSKRRVRGRGGLFGVDVELRAEFDDEVECVRLTLFAGGDCCWSPLVEGGERVRGSATPSMGNESDFRRVL